VSNAFQPGFAQLVSAVDAACTQRFGRRLLAAYVAGSVASGEAWPGASDLDWFAFIPDQPTPADRCWRRRAQARLADRFPIVSKIHLNVFPMDRLATEPYWRFILRYNAVRLRGADLVAKLAHRGHRTPRPGPAIAKKRLPFVRNCLAEALAGRRVPALAELPTAPALATRKLVRNFVLVEGAHLLMAMGCFQSFRQDDVLQGLHCLAPRWRGLFRAAQQVLGNPRKANIPPRRFMEQAQPFVEWMIQTIEQQTVPTGP